MPQSPEELNLRFDHHAPPDQATGDAHSSVRLACKQLAATLNDLLPDCRETSLTLTSLEETMFWANAAIARHPRPTT